LARVLIVDDEDAYRRTLTAICRRAGHESKAASTGPEAIGVAAEFAPDLLIGDWGLAGEFDGLELARRLQKENEALQVILITGYSAQDVRDIKKPRLFAVLEKPFGVEEVRTALNSALGSRAMRPATTRPAPARAAES
jgi:CheY-like chemotaxis protein